MSDLILHGLNDQQRSAVSHENGPLLIIAGAGTGKTKTLVHRVAQLLERDVDPGRILLLTFSRRAAAEMLRRVEALLSHLGDANAAKKTKHLSSRKIWGGTFHAMASRLLRLHGQAIGLDPAFTIHDRTDSEDLLDVVRTELGLAKTDRRFPKKATCLAIYSHCVNAQLPLEQVLPKTFPWCQEHVAELKRLFQGYVDHKESAGVLDYDDLLLFWHGALSDPATVEKIRSRFDCVLVDEYQDTNRLQSEIVRLLRPDGTGVTVVGDDAQSIYSFRAASVRNILDFPQQFADTTVVKLEQNYRSSQAILHATNAVIAQARERFTKEIWSDHSGGQKPCLMSCQDEDEQAAFVIQQILEQREAGVDLRRQAVLFRTSHHSIVLETELARRNVPFVKYGGLKFMETAHVKDLLALLRLAENPRDLVAGTRVLKLLPGIGPRKAQQLMARLLEKGGDFRVWAEIKLAGDAEGHWPALVQLMIVLRTKGESDVPGQVLLARKFYTPLLELRYDHAQPRLRDLEQIEQLAARFGNRATMLAELTLDPPNSTEDFAGDPLLDDDYLILSTIHSSKGLEWDAVYVIHAADGNIPSDMATGDAEQIDEELRLFYVALTRAKRSLYVCFPLRYYHANRGRKSDRHGYAQLTRFISKDVKPHFDCRVMPTETVRIDAPQPGVPTVRENVRQKARAMWS